ncbi:MAG TPA: hypothetical protein PLZ55_15145 [bacterium]|nr:hypothetical protein [bacterium]
MKQKTFDCVEMMHQGGEKILREIEGMTPQEETEYWRRQTEKLRDRQRELRTRQVLSASHQHEKMR